MAEQNPEPDLVPSAAPIAKVWYRLAPREMQELSELLGKQFSMGSTDPLRQEEGRLAPDVH